MEKWQRIVGANMAQQAFERMFEIMPDGKLKPIPQGTTVLWGEDVEAILEKANKETSCKQRTD